MELNSFMERNKEAIENNEIGQVSDGYHTFNELYDHRALLTAALFNTVFRKYAWKSKQHYDPDFPMYKNMFIVGVETPEGQATYHYDIDPFWDLFHVKELDRAPEFDGHSPEQAIQRLLHFSKQFEK